LPFSCAVYIKIVFQRNSPRSPSRGRSSNSIASRILPTVCTTLSNLALPHPQLASFHLMLTRVHRRAALKLAWRRWALCELAGARSQSQVDIGNSRNVRRSLRTQRKRVGRLTKAKKSGKRTASSFHPCAFGALASPVFEPQYRRML
jgi:hypothetical protein